MEAPINIFERYSEMKKKYKETKKIINNKKADILTERNNLDERIPNRRWGRGGPRAKNYTERYRDLNIIVQDLEGQIENLNRELIKLKHEFEQELEIEFKKIDQLILNLKFKK